MAREDKNKTIAIVTYPGVGLLDLVATKKVLNRLAMGTKYRPVSVGECTEAIDSNTPLRIVPEKRFEEVPARAGLESGGTGDRGQTEAAHYEEPVKSRGTRRLRRIL
jgi:hypothetical protein